MHLNILLPFTCILATLVAAAPTASSPLNPLAPHALAQREPADLLLGFDSSKRDASAEPAKKGHFGGPDSSKRDASAEPARKGHFGSPDGSK